jgi:signal transduction histidine kinase
MPSLKESVNLLDSTYTQIRNLSHALQPSNFVDNAFLELVENYTKHLATVDQLEVSLHAYPKNEINQLNVELLNDLFILLQELLTNVIKHAKAQHVDISFNLLSDHLSLIFEDDGNGFDPKNSADGIGLNNIKHRVQLWNGNFEIDTRTKRGTIVSITIPLNLTEDED